MVERGENEGAGNEPGHERIHDNLHAPVNVLIGKDEKFF
jgi:hypothetical protein